ncbi:helix-turn-helix transcriptional regulator [Spirosoma sp. KNUC1025]|uniref:ArsR/SmtB family transcription factor n=1 Tax=Spirosoma sp. KNUC1025 TaxID=2894082 RepID=UPI003866FDDC|nr:metalloregulator ArsR/SmtB family transcription factor [Spirosoma sp. KNUC1025]
MNQLYPQQLVTDSLKIDQLVAALDALAQPCRLQIMLALSQTGALPAGVLQQQLQLNIPILSSHLTCLQEQRLLSSQQRGHEQYYALADASLIQVMRLIQTNYM